MAKELTRFEVEDAIHEALKGIWKLYKEYHPEGDFLSLSIGLSGMTVFNAHYERDRYKPIDGYWRHENAD